MRSLFMFAVGATLGLIAGLLLVTIEPFDGGGETGPGPTIGIGIGDAGIWLGEPAIEGILRRELEFEAEADAPAMAVVDILEEGLILLELNVLTEEQEIPHTMTLNPGVADGAFEITIEEFEEGNEDGAELIATILESEVRALLMEDRGEDEAPFRLTAITTTSNRLALEVDIEN